MRKPNLKKVFAGVLAVCLAGTYGKFTDAAVFAADENKPALIMSSPRAAAQVQITGMSASLEGNIGMNFFAKIPESLLNSDDAEVRFHYSGKTEAVAVKDGQYDSKNDWYKFTCYISAKEMHDEITVSVFDGAVQQNLSDSKGKAFRNNEYSYSLEKYFDKLEKGVTDPKLSALIKATSDYGYFSQKLFNYNTENLEERTLSEAVSSDELQKFSMNYQNLPDGVDMQMSLLLKSETAIRLYFSGDPDKLGASMTVDGKQQELKDAGNDMKYIEIGNIAAANLDKEYTVKADDNCEIKVSALSYAYAVLNSEETDEANKDAMKALYLYSQAAEAYAEKNEPEKKESEKTPENDSDPNSKIKITIKIDGKIKL